MFLPNSREDSVLTEEIIEDVNIFYRGLSKSDVNFSTSQMAILFSYFKPVVSVKNSSQGEKFNLLKTALPSNDAKDVKKKDVSNIWVNPAELINFPTKKKPSIWQC